MAIVLKLGEYVVPYLDITVAFTANGTARLAAAVLLTAVIVDLGTWTARTCAMLPEVVLFAEAEDLLCRNTDLFIPDVKCLVIISVNRRIQTVFLQTYDLS